MSRPGAPADAGPTGTATCAAADTSRLPAARPGEPDQHRHEQHDADPADERPGAPHRPGHARDRQPGHHHDEPDGGEHRPVRQHVAAEHGGRRGRGRRASHQMREAGQTGQAGREQGGTAHRAPVGIRPRHVRARGGDAQRHRGRDDDRHRQPGPRRVHRRAPHPEHTRPEHRGEPEDDRFRGPRTARDAGGHGVHPRTRTCRDQPHLGVISISMRFHCQGTRPAPLSTRQEPDDRACEVTIQHSTWGTTSTSSDVVTELHLLTGAGTTAATATADAVVVGVLPARLRRRRREGRTAARPGRGGGRRGLRRRAGGAARRGGRDGPGGRGRQDPHAAGRSPRRWSSPSGSARPGTTARRPSSCAAPRERRPARWPARTTR